MKNDNCLVTVGVLTYNSSKYVLETLNSIYNQTYDNIELIISDDGSCDETINIVKIWVEQHESRFKGAQLLTVIKNTGTAANCNRLIRASKGDWCKFIAGDDVLLPDGIQKVIDYLADKPEIKWLFAKSLFYRNVFRKDCLIKEELSRYNDGIFKQSTSAQYRRMMVGNPFVGPGHFFKIDLLNEVNGFDEDFGILEDYPMWLKLMGKGERCYFFDEFVAGYRLADTNVCANNQRVVNKRMAGLLFASKKKYLFGKTDKKIEWNARLRYAVDMLFSISFMNKRTPIRSAIYNWCCKIINHFLQ